MFRNRNWFGRNIWKPKNPHSLEHLKYLYNVLSKNQTVSESNRGLLVETLRSIAEILIWGDQNDGSVFDFFLEKNMLSFFLKILKQKCGSYVCVQLLQTLNILFENIRNETSLYYLLSNNHVNSIIVHKFDFSDEEVMAYYISFLKTLSLKLNCHTVHFFYNEHTNDFPLYTEAIKFFNHSESMVRIAVRTLTLNVYRVDDKSMLKFIRDRTAAPYFSNLVWFIGKHIMELDSSVHTDINQFVGQNRLSDLVAEHLDHLHYLNDILCLNIEDLNIVLIEHLLNKLLIPWYIMSLLPLKNTRFSVQNDKQAHISSSLSLFLLSQVFLIIKEKQLVNALAKIILKGTPDNVTFKTDVNDDTSCIDDRKQSSDIPDPSCNSTKHSNGVVNNDHSCDSDDSESTTRFPITSVYSINITDEEKEQRLAQEITVRTGSFLEAILENLRCRENDYAVLFALCLLHAISTNSGIEQYLLEGFLLPKDSDLKSKYSASLIEKLIQIISISCQPACRVRLVTLELTTMLLKKLVIVDSKSILLDEHYAAVIGVKEESTSLLRSYYKNEDIFLDMFEDEYYDIKKRPLNVEWLMMDSNLLLQPANTPMTGVEFCKRLPCGEVERARRAIRVFLLIRDLVMCLSEEVDTQLPLTDRNGYTAVGTSLDLTQSDLINCIVVSKDGSKCRRFLATDKNQLVLVEPHARLFGWGVNKLAGFLHDVEVTGDKEESKCLHVTIHHTNINQAYTAKFLFDDHIRCMAAKQKLVKGRAKARKKKMMQIAKLLDLPVANQPATSMLASRQNVTSVLYGSCYNKPPSKTKPISDIISPLRSHYALDGDSSRSTPLTSCESSPKLLRRPVTRLEEIQLVNIPSTVTEGSNSNPPEEDIVTSDEVAETETSLTEQDREKHRGQVRIV
ncbi:protein CLEC16A homolog isoform X2 [Planococcus citri]|uniref:protein CLEC16A homolog isoform X2 n=1 Tax=Planococcus citri TaxID=170843 RepID=UPI0031F7FCB1